MTRVRNDGVDRTRSDIGLASWYVPGRSDGFGDRLLMFDNTGTPSLEMLRIRRRLAEAGGLEDALRDRVDELRTFTHPAFAPIRAVERLEDDTLAVVSVHKAGQRLSELFDQRPPSALHPRIVVWLLRELGPALAALQAHGMGLPHGAVTADRIVLTPDGQLCIVEHMLGSVLRGLRLSAWQMWTEFGLLSVPADRTTVVVDQRADVVQLAGVALSLLLARPLPLDDVRLRLPALLDEFSESSTRSASPQHAPVLRAWLERALQVRGDGYETAAEAVRDLKDLPSQRGLRIPAAGSSAEAGGQPADVPPATGEWPAAPSTAVPQVPPMLTAVDDLPPSDDRLTQSDVRSAVDQFLSENTLRSERTPVRSQDAPAPAPPPGPVEMAAASVPWPRPSHVDAPRESSPRSVPVTASPEPSPRRRPPLLRPVTLAAAPSRRAGWSQRELVVAGLGALAVAEAVVIVLFVMGVVGPKARETAAITSRAAASTDSTSPGAADIERRGAEGGRRPAATGGSADAVDPKGRDAGVMAGASAQKFGGVRLVSSFPVTVLEGERVLGSTAAGAVFATAGLHRLELVNQDLGYRGSMTVTFREGEIRSVRMPPVTALLNINAQPWANVFIDGVPVGETPLGNVPLSLGSHTLVFRHPVHGERTETVVVRADRPNRYAIAYEN